MVHLSSCARPTLRHFDRWKNARLHYLIRKALRARAKFAVPVGLKLRWHNYTFRRKQFRIEGEIVVRAKKQNDVPLRRIAIKKIVNLLQSFLFAGSPDQASYISR